MKNRITITYFKKKRICRGFTLWLLFCSFTSYAQVKMGDNPLEINPYAILEIESSEKGILLPRLTTQERDESFKNDIPLGLLFFNKDFECIQIYLDTVSEWQCLGASENMIMPPLVLENMILTLGDESSVDLSRFLDNTDQQQLSLIDNTLFLENGGSVDLGKFMNENSDAQQLALEGNILSLERGGQVDLSAFKDMDDQTIDLLEWGGTTLSISLADDGEAPKTIDFSSFLDNTDQQQLSLIDNTLFLENGGSVDLSKFMNESSDAQQLTLEGNVLSLERGGQVDLSAFKDMDDQTIDLLEWGGTTLSISLADDGEAPKTIDFSSFLDNTDQQQLSLIDNTLFLENGGNVDLSKFMNENSDVQQLSLNGNTLSLERGGIVDLSGVNTDSQQITINDTTLSLTNGGTVSLESFLDNTDEQSLIITLTDSQTISIEIEKGNVISFKSNDNIVFSLQDSNTFLMEAKGGSFSTQSNVTSNQVGIMDEDDFVFGSNQLNNDSSTTSDNKRFFYDKSKGAFRAGFVQSDQWDEKNLGTYSIAMGRNTIASGYHATAFGSSTVSDAWYSTAMGQGTQALSHSETAVGRYNSGYDPLGSTNKWELTDRLFVIGNGTGSSNSERSDALVMLKNGDTTVFGNWTGPGFSTISDRRFKKRIEPLKAGLQSLSKIATKQYFLRKDSLEVQHFGILADELQKIMPNLVYESGQEQSYLSINYTELIPVLINAINELNAQVKSQNRKIEMLEFQMKRLQKSN